ncbi:MAG: hypothetical protein EP329_23930 [Deltaproteobacteria bacterium]|nr:MAG: hypothetical protein EP329_23930 [Deltaproteobacteria bacterium]
MKDLTRKLLTLLVSASVVACSGDDGTSSGSDSSGGDVAGGNAAPVVTIVRPSEGALVAAGESVLFTGNVVDDRDPSDALTVVWTTDRATVPLFEGRPSESGNTTFDTDVLEVGEHLITLTATDTEGRSASANLVLTVNTAPGAPVVAIAPTAPTTADDLVASVTVDAADPNRAASELTYSYRWFKDGAFADLTATRVPSTATARGQVWEVRVLAHDGMAEGAEATASVTIGNGAPSCEVASLFPTAAGTDADLTCTCSGWADPDGDSAADHCAFFDGATALTGHDGSCVLSADLTARGMDIRCVYTPNDGTDDGESRESASVPVLNGPPSAPGVVLTPDTANALTELSCTLGAPSVDPDGDSISYSVAWVVNGYENPGVTVASVVAGALETSAGAYARKGDKISCRLRASDGTATSAPAQSDELTLDNAPPEVGIVLIMPAHGETTLNELAVLSCQTQDATDPDGDSVTLNYSWTVNGEPVVGADGALLDGSAFDRGDVVACAITATDGQATSEPITSKSPVTIKNAPPSLVSATLSPATPNPYSLLTCTPEGWSDPDGDALEVSYVWYTVDGSGNRTVIAGATGGTYTPSTLSAGDQVLCEVTPRNGADVGVTVESAAVTLVPPPPTAPVVVVVADDGANGPVRCDFVTPALHFPGAVSYTYFWTLNDAAEVSGGASLTGLTDCDLVTCRAVATSGETVLSSAPAQLLLPVGDDCDTGEVCRTPTCKAEGGCTTIVADAIPCDDGNPCTLGDHCSVGVCVQSSMADTTVTCDDGLFCTAESHCDGLGSCVGSGDPCNADGNGCVIGTCVESGDRCDYANKPDGVACDDGNGCTLGDSCDTGACVPTAQQDCTGEDDACHIGVCTSLGADDFVCEPEARPVGAPCENDDFCIVESTCDAGGLCSGGTPRDCQAEAGDACHTATCDSAEAVCKTLTSPDGTPCDDEDACTLFDTCYNGVCNGPDNVCVEQQLSLAGTAAFGPVVAALGSGRHATQWWNGDTASSGFFHLRRTAAFRSREEVEGTASTTWSPYVEAVHGTWETRLGVNRLGDHMAFVMAVEETEALEAAHFGVAVWNYLGSTLSTDPNALVMSTAPRDVPLTDWSIRTLPILTTSDTFGVVFGARWSGGTNDSEVITPASLLGVTYAPPTGLGTFGTLRVLVNPADCATDVLAFDARSLGDDSGDFVLVWLAPDKQTLRLRRFSQVGIPKTPSYTELVPGGEISRIRLAIQPGGGRVLVIEQPGGVDGDGLGIYAAVLGADDSVVSDWEQVSEGFYGAQRVGEVATFSDGGYVVVYDDEYGDSEGYGVFAQRYTADGSPDGDPIVVNTRTAGDQLQPFVTVLDTQEFVVAFRDSNGYVWTRRYKRDGESSVSRPERRVNATTPASQSAPRAASLADGTTLVAYRSPIAGRTDTEILARVVDPFGVEVLPEMMVNANDAGDQYTPWVGAGPQGWVVMWHTSSAIRARIVDPDQGPIGGEIQLHDQGRRAEIAVDPTTGRFLVATTHATSGGRGSYVRLFAADGSALTAGGGLPGTLYDSASVAAHPGGEGYAVAATAAYGASLHKINADGVRTGGATPEGWREGGLFTVAFSPSGAEFVPCQTAGGVYKCQRYSWASFAKIGAALTFGTQNGLPAVAWLDDDRFVVVQGGTDGSGSAIQVARRFKTGAKDKPDFLANLTWSANQSSPFIVKALATDYLVGWQSENQDGSSYGIFMRLFPGY